MCLQKKKHVCPCRVRCLFKGTPFTTIIPEADGVLEEAHAVAGNTLMLVYTEDVKSKIYVYRLDGTPVKALETPVGSVFDVSGERRYNHFLFSITSFDTPRVIYEVDVEGGTWNVSVFHRTSVRVAKTAFCQILLLHCSHSLLCS